MNELKQNRPFVKRSFRFTDDKLFYTISGIGKENEVAIPFEQITGEKVSYKISIRTLLALSLTLYVIATIIPMVHFLNRDTETLTIIALVILATALLISYLFTRYNLWKIELVSGYFILFDKKAPSTEETNNFIESMYEARNTYLIENYGNIDKNLSYEGQLENIKWLKAVGAFSKDDFLQKYEELKNTINPDNFGIGFGKDTSNGGE